MKIDIRTYADGDWDAICRIHDEARKDVLHLAGLSDAFVPLSIAAEREGLFDYTVIVAAIEGAQAGFAAYSKNELAWLYVAPKFGRRGIGRKLVKYALDHMDRPVFIEVLMGNDAALALYHSCGFEITETLSGRMPGNEAFSVSVNCLTLK